MDRLLEDARHALRRLRQQPGFALVAILTLAIGIGANSAIFSLVNGVLLNPLPYPDSDRLVLAIHEAPGLGFPEVPLSEATYLLCKEQHGGFEDLLMYSGTSANLTGDEGPERVQSALVTANFFDVLGIGPVMGRGFVEGEDGPGAPPVAVLSDGIWRRRYGADPDILGRTILVDGVAVEIVGVMEPDFRLPSQETAFWRPLEIDPAEPNAGNFSYPGIARLRPGVTIEAAKVEMAGLLGRLPDMYGDEFPQELFENAQFGPLVISLKEVTVGDVRATLWVLMGTVGFVLLIACANVANLFLVRAEGRQREVALRSALGASRLDLLSYYLTESIVLALFAGIAGLGLGFAGLRWLAAIGPQSVPRLEEIGIDAQVLTFTAGVSLFASLLFGIIPVLKQGRQDLVDALKEGSQGAGTGRGRHRARNTLVGAQVALALVLLVASGLMIRSFARLRAVDPGFVADDVFTVALSLPPAEYPEPSDAARFYQELLDEVAALPGVESVGAVTGVPLSGYRTASGLHIDDHPVEEGALPPVPETMNATAGYFRSMGIPLLNGRGFERADHELRTGAVVISESLANHYWPDESPLGRTVRPEEEAGTYEIVGVVGDVRHVSLTEESREMIYYPMLGVTDGEISGAWRMVLTIRSPLPTSSLAPTVRRAIWDLDPNLPLISQSMNEVLDTAMAPTSFAMMMLGIAAAVALLLGAIGVYGVISYIVSQRTREIGIRMALGARSADVRSMVVRQGLIVTLIGVGVGIIGALALTRLMQSLLFEVSPTDVLTYVIVAPTLVLVATLATWIPARRAAGVSPAVALRSE